MKFAVIVVVVASQRNAGASARILFVLPDFSIQRHSILSILLLCQADAPVARCPLPPLPNPTKMRTSYYCSGHCSAHYTNKFIWTCLLAPRCLYCYAVVLFCVRSTTPHRVTVSIPVFVLPCLPPSLPPSLSSSQALEELEEDTGPSYAAQPSTLPQAPSMVPESAGPSGVDEFGLPVAPTPARPAEEVRL